MNKRFVLTKLLKGTSMRFDLTATTLAVLTSATMLVTVRPATAQKNNKATVHYHAANNVTSEATYGAAFRTIMQDYRNKMAALHQQSLPPSTIPVRERQAMIDRRMNEIANLNTSYAMRLGALKPPTRFKVMHSATRAFFQTSANSIRAFGAAMRSGNRQAALAALNKADRAEQLAQKRMAEARQ